MNSTTEQYDAQAEQWAARMRAGTNFLHEFIEKPAMASATPDLIGRRVLALGCGSGEEVEMLFDKGAATVHGIDLSQGLLDIARRTYPKATFEQRSIDNLGEFADGAFDFIYSSMVLHYLPNWRDLLAQCARVLKPGGQMLFSVGHPVKWGSQILRNPSGDSFMLGYQRPADAPQVAVGDYLGTRLLKDRWFDSLEVEFYHRPFEAMFADILNSPLKLARFMEPAPSAQSRELDPEYYATHARIPLIAIFLLER